MQKTVKRGKGELVEGFGLGESPGWSLAAVT